VAKLNQILAIEKGVKSRNYAAITAADKQVQKEDLLQGITRTYTPKDDEGDRFPDETKLVQVTVAAVLGDVRTQLAEVWDITATKEWANQEARADVTLPDGTVVLTQAPVTYLLFLEKQLTDHLTMVARLPVLDPAQSWHLNGNSDAYTTEPIAAFRTQKVPKAFVKYEATPEHPAQVDTFTEDVVVGTWTTIRLSGALPATRRAELVRRTEVLLQAVKQAREAANDLTVTDQHVADPLLDYLLS
jgi:hypothetical protein